MSAAAAAPAPVVPASGLAVGLNSGFRVTKLKKHNRIAGRKGYRGPHKLVVNDVIREVCGLAPYEKRVIELLRNGFDKKALRLSKAKLGTHQRGKKKREEMGRILQQITLAARKKKEVEDKEEKAKK